MPVAPGIPERKALANEASNPLSMPRLLPSIALAVLTVGLYAKATQFDFVNYDDHVYVTQNPQVLSGVSLASLLDDLRATRGANWHPLTWLSLQWDATWWPLFDRDLRYPAAGYHLTNIVLHTLNTILLFTFLARATGAYWRSWVTAAIFAWHPLHVESVAWISERKDVLSVFFGLLALHAYWRYACSPLPPGQGSGVRGKTGTGMGWVLGCFILSLVSKPMLVSFPFVLLLMDYWPLERWHRIGPARLAGEKAWFFLFSAIVCAVTLVVQRDAGAVRPFDLVPLSQRLANGAWSYVLYMKMAVWPTGLSVLYPYRAMSWTDSAVAFACAVLVAISAAAVLQHRRAPWFMVGWFWFMGTLVPVIGIVQVGEQAMADRYTYWPLIGLSIVIVWGLSACAATFQLPAWLRAGATATALATCLVISWRQLDCWQNSLALWSNAEQVIGPISATVENGMGTTLSDLGRFTEAADVLGQAVRLDPQQDRPHVNLGNVYARLHKTDFAIDQYQKAIDLNPNGADAHFNLGLLLLREQRDAEAAVQLAEATRLSPDDSQAHNLLAIALEKLGRFAEAAHERTIAAGLDPGLPARRLLRSARPLT
jgi:cytochrome c-type biogenesis protein CcmH/NrfG